MYRLTPEGLQHMALGATLLGAGGGCGLAGHVARQGRPAAGDRGLRRADEGPRHRGARDAGAVQGGRLS